jgi:FtsP/CotA-like multicopper oxidase with cupredoxin domain
MTPLTRRTFLAGSSAAAVAFPHLQLVPKAGAAAVPVGAPSLRYVPHTTPLPIPGRLAPTTLNPAPGTPEAAVGSAAVYHGIAPEYQRGHPAGVKERARYPEKHYRLEMRETTHQWIPGVDTPALGYNGIVPGPLLRARTDEPAVVRVTNRADVEASLHLHGGHNPAHADGHPCFYIFPGRSRDYYYPFALPLTADGQPDVEHAVSTLWYHDHGNDVTARNVMFGLAGLCLVTDDLEERLIADRVLPPIDGPGGAPSAYDIPLALIDQAFNRDGSLRWDPLDFDGRIGDVPTVNGVAQPFLAVERRKYRFRLLCSSLARVYHLRIVRGGTAVPFLQIANDAFLLPQAEPVSSVEFVPGNRADIIVDFSAFPAGTELYLQNIMEQTNGRKPKGVDPRAAVNLLKFVVSGGVVPNDVTVAAGTPLRPFTPLHPSEATATRRWSFERRKGAWMINEDFWSPFRSQATPVLGAVERWIFENKSGGWWHPAHAHLEGHQIISINGRTPPRTLRYHSDTSPLADGMTIEVLLHLRTYTGPFVMHCHNNNHEDMRMMVQFETVARDAATGRPRPSLFNGRTFSIPAEISGIPAADVAAHPELFT